MSTTTAPPKITDELVQALTPPDYELTELDAPHLLLRDLLALLTMFRREPRLPMSNESVLALAGVARRRFNDPTQIARYESWEIALADLPAWFEAQTVEYHDGDHDAALRYILEDSVPAAVSQTIDMLLGWEAGSFRSHLGDLSTQAVKQ